MAFYKDPEEARECPVCYEGLSGDERTLSCGHVFCHDCLVRTLVARDGTVRDSIVCPVCRHLTFVTKKLEAPERSPGEEGQTLEVPLPPPPPQPTRDSTPAAAAAASPGWASRCLRGVSERIRRQRTISPSHKASQIFVISSQGRPMAEEEDALGAVETLVQAPRRRRRKFCTTARCLLVLLSTFTILALVAATLPWILLA